MFRYALILGLLSGIGPFAIDMYLPALPAIAAGLAADVASVQMSLLAFFLAVGICQLFYGPIADMAGRKPPLYFGLAIFVLGSIGCALAPDIGTLVAFRAVQGIGACACMVIPRAVVRDLHSGADAAKLMSLLMLVFSVSPVFAPLVGSAVIQFSDWRAIFWIIAGGGAMAIVLSAVALPESMPRAARHPVRIAPVLRAYGTLLRDRNFIGLCLIGALGISSFFIYLAHSSFVIIQGYGLTPTAYSLIFGVNAVAFIGSAQLTSPLIRRLGLRRVIRLGVTGYAATVLALLAAFALGWGGLVTMSGFLLLAFGWVGIILPTSTVLALEDHGARAGTASALLGSIHMFTGTAVVALLGLAASETALAMVAGIACCGLAALLAERLLLPPGGRSPAGRG